jgi:DNA polymerase-4
MLKDSIRLLGVSLSSLVREQNQALLFIEQRKERALLQTIDAVNDRYGDFKLIWASYLKNMEPPRVISPAWKPSGIRHIGVKR